MKNRTKIFSLLCAATLLAATPAEAIIHKMVVLGKKVKGVDYYIYGLGEYHAENLIVQGKGTNAARPAEQEARKLEQLTGRLTALTISQGDALNAYITQLPKDQCIFINEDMLAYNGDDEVIKSRIQNHHARLKPLGLGINGFLAYVTQLSKLKSWQCINAECRYFDLLKDTTKREELFQRTLKKINHDVDQSTALPIVKWYSKNWLETLKDTSAASLSGLQNGRLVDARIPLLIWEHQHIKHIVLTSGSGHINDLLPLLKKIGYKEILSEENVIQLNPTTIDLRFLNSVPLDLKKLFGQCIDLQAKQSQILQNTELKQPEHEAKTCGFCNKKEPEHRCPCKEVYYCSTECQKQHWKEHKKVCATKKINSSLTTPIADNNKVAK